MAECEPDPVIIKFLSAREERERLKICKYMLIYNVPLSLSLSYFSSPALCS